MLQATRTLLRDMEAWPWFEHVGEPIDDPGVVAVGSWDEALEPQRSYVWECLTLQVSNVASSSVNARDWCRFQTWNPVVVEAKLVLKPLLGRIRALGTRLSLPEDRFYHQVAWDLVGMCTETEFADVFPPLFGVPALAPWYRAGRFPCGWDGPCVNTYWNGEFPPYRLYVF